MPFICESPPSHTGSSSTEASMMWTHKFIMDRLHCTSPATMERRTKNVEVRKARESREDRHRHRTKRHDEPRRTIERSKPIHKQHLSITCTFFFSFVSFASRVLSPPFSCARFPFGPSPLFLLLSLGSTHHAVCSFVLVCCFHSVAWLSALTVDDVHAHAT